MVNIKNLELINVASGDDDSMILEFIDDKGFCYLCCLNVDEINYLYDKLSDYYRYNFL